MSHKQIRGGRLIKAKLIIVISLSHFLSPGSYIEQQAFPFPFRLYCEHDISNTNMVTIAFFK